MPLRRLGAELKDQASEKVDEAKAKGEVHTSTTGTAHKVSASHDSNAPHGDTTTAKVEIKTTGTDKPPLV
jgi:hypothetical protein